MSQARAVAKVRTATSTTTSSTQATASKNQVRECPECAGTLRSDETLGETLCIECGLVVDEEEIDHGPEWRSFTQEDRENRKRTGAPRTELRHDRGLSTKIGKGTDGQGNSLSGKNRRKMFRLRRRHRRAQADSKERNLRHAIGEIKRMASALAVPKSTQETAAVIFRRAHDDGHLPGRSVEGVATAALYTAIRMGHIPKTIDTVANTSRVSQDRVWSAYKSLLTEQELEVPPENPLDFIVPFADEVGVSREIERLARDFLELAQRQNYTSGKVPSGLAAGALYAAAHRHDEELTQEELAEVADVCAVTIRTRYLDFLEMDNQSEE
jgi:transcription initiation factor TFIIB